MNELAPSVETIKSLQLLSEQLAKSRFSAYGSAKRPGQHSAEDLFWIMMRGLDLGLRPMEAIAGLNVGRGSKIEASAKTLTALMLRGGVTLEYKTATAEKAEIGFSRGVMKHTETYTIGEARQAGIIADNPEMWRKYPADMLVARCLSRGGRRIAADLIQGLYVEGELGGSDEPAAEARPAEKVRVSVARADQDKPEQEEAPQAADAEESASDTKPGVEGDRRLASGLIKNIHMLVKEMGIASSSSDENYRYLLWGFCKRQSTRHMTLSELQALRDMLEGCHVSGDMNDVDAAIARGAPQEPTQEES